VTAVSKAELFAEADILSIHMVLSERSRGLVGASELAMMKPTSILVNTSRGPIVDEGALVDALQRQVIACAALARRVRHRATACRSPIAVPA
jgi:phosphoglycerate dehydrogenase-like enzyme